MDLSKIEHPIKFQHKIEYPIIFRGIYLIIDKNSQSHPINYGVRVKNNRFTQ